jgi:two-component system, OmpR family, catabolic regulation response regulator CreB
MILLPCRVLWTRGSEAQRSLTIALKNFPAPPMSPPYILLLEDEQAIADTLLYALRSEGFEVGHVRLASEALAAFVARPPALAILDVGVPDGNGFDVCRAIRKTSELPIVFLTARGEEIDRVLGLELGADDYVTKPFSPREVCARVKAILRRSAGHGSPNNAAPSAEAGAVLQLDEAAQRIRCGGQPLALTRYEYGLLATLLKRPQRIFSRAELMELVWGDAPDSSERTVDAHIKLLRAKLRACGLDAELIQTHRNMGYALQAPG